MFYLPKKCLGQNMGPKCINDVNIYDHSPWELPSLSYLHSKDRIWYFFCPRVMQDNGKTPRKTLKNGYWKETGRVTTLTHKQYHVGDLKTFIYHIGVAPKGERTNWVMKEFNLTEYMIQEMCVVDNSYVLCKVYEKSGPGPKNGAEYGAPYDKSEWDNKFDNQNTHNCPSVYVNQVQGSDPSNSNCGQNINASETNATNFAGIDPTFNIEELLEGFTNQEQTTTADVQMEDAFTIEELVQGTQNDNNNNTSSLVQMESAIDDLMGDPNQDDTTWIDAMREPSFTIQELFGGPDITLDEFLDLDFGKL